MGDTLLPNLFAYGVQVTCLAGLGTAMAALLRIDAAAVRYHYWRALLAACVVLPWLQPWRVPGGSGRASGGDATGVDVLVTGAAPGATTFAAGIDWALVAIVVVAAGALARLLIVGTGLVRLRQMRRLGRPAPDHAHAELQALLGTGAEVRYVDRLRQPVTFGARRPVVLLPEALHEHTPDVQRAVLCHELVHVSRRDWIWVVAEETLRACFWFHPAMWWLIERVQLAREEVVDELTVLATGRRRAYLEALMAFADESPLAPTAAFARRTHLFRRVTLITKEAAMSSTRVVLTSAVLALVVSLGGWYVVEAFPLMGAAAGQELLLEPGPLEQRAKPVSPENPVPRRINFTAPEYPAEAEAIAARGTVTLRITLDELGRVAEMRRTGVSYSAPTLRATGTFSNVRAESLQTYVERASGAEAAATILAGLESMTRAAANAVRAWRYEPPHQGPLTFTVTVPVGPVTRADATQTSGGAVSSTRTGTASGSAAAAAGGAAPVRVGGNIGAPTKVRDVRPVYPPEAQAARVGGVVIIEARIGVDGAVEEAHVLRSVPLLDQAAIDAVLQWRFTPTLLNGTPVPVIMTVTVNFTLM